MFKPIEKTPYLRIGYLPEQGKYILRNPETHKLELWANSQSLSSDTVEIRGQELEFYRAIEAAWRVVDSAYNRANYLDEIGRIYIDQPPSYIAVKEL